MIIKGDFAASSIDLFRLGTFLSILLQTINLYNIDNIINLYVYSSSTINHCNIRNTIYILHKDKTPSSNDFFRLGTFLSILLQL